MIYTSVSQLLNYLGVGMARNLNLHRHARPLLLLLMLRRLLLLALLRDGDVESVGGHTYCDPTNSTSRTHTRARTVALAIASLIAAAPPGVKAPQRSALA